MSRLVIAASVVALAAASANCANSGQANSIDIVGPSVMTAAASDATMAKGGKPGIAAAVNTISLVPLDSTDGVVHFGQHVTFDVNTTATDYPWVTLRCSQNGINVYQQSNAMFRIQSTFTLGPTPLWQSGGADCTATLESWDEYSKNGKITALASLPFAVAP